MIEQPHVEILGLLVIPLIVWSWMFELWLPNTKFARDWCIVDPWDVVYYSLGALAAAVL